MVSGIIDNSAAQAGGLEVGDIIIGINDTPTPYYQDFVKHIKQFKNQDVAIIVDRDFDTLALPMHLGEDAVVGAYLAPLSEYFNLETKDYTFWQAIPAGFSKTFSEISDYWKQLKLIFNPSTKAYESVGGFISIGKIFPDAWDWQRFWLLTAFLSIALGFINVLPIPALDGGHALFALFELVTRKRLNDNFLLVVQYFGMYILLGLMILAQMNDILRLFNI
jgi:regulator of sigma E protease